MKVLFRIFACAELEVQIAEIFIELLFALQQKVQPGFRALTGEDVLGPEGVGEQCQGEKYTGQFALQSSHGSKSSVAGFAANLFTALALGGVQCDGVRRRGQGLASRPAPHQQNGAQQRGGKDGERRNPGYKIEAVGGWRGQYDSSIFPDEHVENLLVAFALRDRGLQLIILLCTRRAACVVTLAKELRAASTGTCHSVPEVVESRVGIRGAKREAHRDGECANLQRLYPKPEMRLMSLHWCPPFNAGSVGADRTGTRREAVDGLMLGTRAIKVPQTSTTRPAQIHPTSGLRNALMMGLPVSGFEPS